jgi:DNA-binding MarR family transcriptional regulator
MEESTVAPLGKLFGLMTKKYIGIVTRQLKHLDIERHFYVIYLIANAEKPYSQKEMAAQLMVDKATMVRIVDYLSNANYIKRFVNENDRREHFLVLTEKGLFKSKEIIEAFEMTDRFFLEGAGQSCPEFLATLQQVWKHVEPLDAEVVKLNYKKIDS